MRNSNDHVKSSLDSRVGDVDVETADIIVLVVLLMIVLNAKRIKMDIVILNTIMKSVTGIGEIVIGSMKNIPIAM